MVLLLRAKSLPTLGNDFAFIQNLKPFIETEPRTFLLRQFEFLIDRGVLDRTENAIKLLKEALGKVNSLFETWPALKEFKNQGLLAAVIYYELKKDAHLSSFVRWVLFNHVQRCRSKRLAMRTT